MRAGALRRVRREVLGVEHRLARRIAAGARIQHAHQGSTACVTLPTEERALGEPRCCCSATAGGRPVDRVDVGHADLVDQPPRVRRDRFEVAALRLGVERAEGERRLAGAGDAGEDDERVARDVDVHDLEVVLARAADPHESIDRHACARQGVCRRGFAAYSGRHGLRVTVASDAHLRRGGDAQGPSLRGPDTRAARALRARLRRAAAPCARDRRGRRAVRVSPRSSCRPGSPAATSASRSSTSRPATPRAACPRCTPATCCTTRRPARRSR